jgi:hypothetical protein
VYIKVKFDDKVLGLIRKRLSLTKGVLLIKRIVFRL